MVSKSIRLDRIDSLEVNTTALASRELLRARPAIADCSRSLQEFGN